MSHEIKLPRGICASSRRLIGRKRLLSRGRLPCFFMYAPLNEIWTYYNHSTNLSSNGLKAFSALRSYKLQCLSDLISPPCQPTTNSVLNTDYSYSTFMNVSIYFCLSFANLTKYNAIVWIKRLIPTSPSALMSSIKHCSYLDQCLTTFLLP